MASVRCPSCGERVKVREGASRLRCWRCGDSFRDDNDFGGEETSRRSRHIRHARKKSSLKVPLIILGSVLGVALVAVVVVLIVRGRKEGTADDAPRTDPSKVTVENFNRLKPGMELAEVEGILGGGKPSSAQDMQDALRKGLGGLKGEFAAGFEAGFAKAGEGVTWRRWEGNNLRVWVVFAKTKSGMQLATYSTALEQIGGEHKQHNGFLTFKDVNDLERLATDRKKEEALRGDPKWVRGPQARELLIGQWRNQNGGYVFKPDGTGLNLDQIRVNFKENNLTYRFIDDTRIEIVEPSLFPKQPPLRQQYEFLVSQDELTLIAGWAHAPIPINTYRRIKTKPRRRRPV